MKVANLDWNRERHRTRDLLLEYDTNIMPPRPRAGGISVVYPWENTSLNILNHQLYLLAIANGFDGTEEDFKQLFTSYVGPRSIMFANYSEFPETGISSKLYFDLEEKILYYWENQYIPVDAMLIANTVLDGGEA